MSFAAFYNDMPSPAAIELDNLAYAGLCAFVVTLSSGGDGWVVGGAVFSTWVILISLGFVALRISVARTIRRPALPKMSPTKRMFNGV